MSWYHIPGCEQDVAVCTRVRLSRNLEDFPYPARLDPARAREIISRVGEVLEKNGFSRQDFADMTRSAAYTLAERQYVSASALSESLPHALFLNEPCNLAVTVCAEEHIRLQSIRPGLELRDATAGAFEVEAILDKALPFAFHERLGYLTRDPADLGTGLRVAVLLCLPVLEMLGLCQSLSQSLERTGQYLRRCGDSGLYLLSHRAATGIREEALISSLDASSHHVITAEREARSRLEGEERERLVDRILRTHAILRVAHRITEDELPSMLSDLRLGAAMGILEDVKVESVTAALIETQPAGLASLEGNTSDRDALRAQSVRDRIVI